MYIVNNTVCVVTYTSLKFNPEPKQTLHVAVVAMYTLL